MAVEGVCDSRFRLVREEFEANFAHRGELGASVCVWLDGETVVDLWGGVAQRSTNTPWRHDTLCVVYSCTKGATALCAHVLAGRGQLDLDAPVARYWPEFARHDKGDIPVRWLLCHQAALPAVRKPLGPGALYDWQAMTAALQDEAPFWQPGTKQAYHAGTFGHLVGEVVRRASGRGMDAYFREEVAGPLGLDFHMGLPEADEPRVAPTVRADPTPLGERPWRFLRTASGQPDSIQGLMLYNAGRRPNDQDSREAHASVLPGSGGLTNARGLAGLYVPLAAGGGGLVDRDTLVRMQETASASPTDGTLLVGMRFSLGFMKSADNRAGPPDARDSIILSPTAFGHAGMGGSLGFADPAARLAFGYAMNKQGRGVGLNPRGQTLVDAVYTSLGCRGCASGFWV
jgi:CubicO group peptidase (beta-lactamase class C family)